MSAIWERHHEDFLYIGEDLPDGWQVRLVHSGETRFGSKVYRISYTMPDGQTVPYTVIKRTGRYERTQWTITVAKTNAERWINLQFHK